MGRQAALIAPGAYFPHEVDDRTANLGIADPGKGLHQFQAVGCGKKFRNIIGRRRLGIFIVGRRCHAFKKERRRHLQSGGDLLQAARADAINALFVFLDLLEGQVNRVGERLLAHRQNVAPHADARANVNIDRIGRLLCHYRFGLVAAPALGLRVMQFAVGLLPALCSRMRPDVTVVSCVCH